MACFIVERYLPLAAQSDVELAAERDRDVADAASSLGERVRHLRTVFLPEDETCFSVFEAASADVLRAANEQLGRSFTRVTRAREVAASDMPARRRGGR